DAGKTVSERLRAGLRTGLGGSLPGASLTGEGAWPVPLLERVNMGRRLSVDNLSENPLYCTLNSASRLINVPLGKLVRKAYLPEGSMAHNLPGVGLLSACIRW
ncbi:MAG: hypothetical protein ACREIQ_10125, partial [Nitrospiria bacterium]